MSKKLCNASHGRRTTIHELVQRMDVKVPVLGLKDMALMSKGTEDLLQSHKKFWN